MNPDEYPMEQLAVRLLGGGSRNLIILHGWGRSAADLMALAELLADGWRIHVFDLPGFGASPPPPASGWGSAEYAALVLRYLDHQGIDHAALLGHSFGGRIAIHLAAHASARVKKLVLIGSHGLRPKRSLGRRLRIAAIRWSGKIVKFIDRTFGLKLYSERFIPLFGSPDYARAGVLRATVVKTVNEDQRENAARIQAPTLLLWGEDDRETPVDMARRFHALIRNSQLVLLPGKEHDPYAGIGSQLCAYHIRPFLDGGN